VRRLRSRRREIWLGCALVILASEHAHLYASTDLYLGQTPPGKIPEVFAPGIISTDGIETDVTFSPDLNEIYFTRSGANWHSVIYVVTYQEGSWSAPVAVSFSGESSKNYPFVSPDGRNLFFDSSGQTNDPRDRDIWVVLRNGDDWGQPRRIGPAVNTSSIESFAAVTDAGDLYFCSRRQGGPGQMDIYRADSTEDGYAQPVSLGEAVNSEYNDFHPFVSPDEMYIVFDSQRPGGSGGNDLYVSLRKDDGSWATADNLGGEVNSPSGDMRPYVSPDGKYLFFSSSRGGGQDIYWVDATVVRSEE
jgi:Tol biopolymer transport system component